MPGLIGPITPGDLVPSTLLGICVLFIFLGWLVPKWFVNQILKQLTYQLELNEQLRDQNRILMEALRESTDSTDKIINAVTQNTSDRRGRFDEVT